MSSHDLMSVNRRHFLKHMAGLAAMAGSATTFIQGLRAAAPEMKKQGKSLIILWMGGGPSHMDLWDLKPGQPTGGEFKPIKTAADGVEISEVLPTVASQFKHLAIVRSLVTNEGSHERGTVLMNTGRQPNPVCSIPHVGAVAGSLLTAKDLALPGFIGIGGTAQRIGPGFLGMTVRPLHGPERRPAAAEHQAAGRPGQRTTEMTERLRRRQRLFYAVEDDFNLAVSAPGRQDRNLGRGRRNARSGCGARLGGPGPRRHLQEGV